MANVECAREGKNDDPVKSGDGSKKRIEKTERRREKAKAREGGREAV
jgi:hypothetical protein